MRLYIAVLDEFPDYMTPTLVAHSMLGAHLYWQNLPTNFKNDYDLWLTSSFKKCVVRVNQKEFNKIVVLPYTYLGHEKHTLDGRHSCAIPLPVYNANVPNVLKFAKLWKPKNDS